MNVNQVFELIAQGTLEITKGWLATLLNKEGKDLTDAALLEGERLKLNLPLNQEERTRLEGLVGKMRK